MQRTMIFPLLLGVIGVGVLVWLGFWQLQRLEWKQAILVRIEAQISSPPIALPVNPDPEADKFLAVQVGGRFEGPEIHVLASRKLIGPGYKVITAFITDDGRRVMVDRGFIATTAKDNPRPAKALTITGNLHWPDETDRFIPKPDLKANIWFARDVDTMARALNTEPVLIMARSETGDGVEAYPVSTAAVANQHLAYAITWFLMAIAWFGMTVFLLSRIKREAN